MPKSSVKCQQSTSLLRFQLLRIFCHMESMQRDRVHQHLWDAFTRTVPKLLLFVSTQLYICYMSHASRRMHAHHNALDARKWYTEKSGGGRGLFCTVVFHRLMRGMSCSASDVCRGKTGGTWCHTEKKGQSENEVDEPGGEKSES